MRIYTFIIVLIFLGCKEHSGETGTADSSDSKNSFNVLLDTYYEDGLKLNPIAATTAGDQRYNDQFPNFLSEAYKEALKNHYQSYKEQVSTFKDSELSESEKMSKSILLWECNINLEGLEFQKDLTPIDQMWSPNLFMGQLASGQSAQPFQTVEDYDNWLHRLDGFIAWLHSAKNNMARGMDVGYVLPKSLIVKVLPQLQTGAESQIERHLFYTPILNMPDTFSEEDQQRLTKAYSDKITNELVPAYQGLYDFMAGPYMEAGRATSGIADTPDGDAYYRYAIKLYTTTDMTADEIHQLGLNEVARISSEMEKVKAQVGFNGSLKNFFDYVRSSKELMPFDEPQEIIDNFNAIHQRMKPQINKLFDKKPKTAFEVRRTEAFREKSASAQYNPGSLDGSRPGIFYVPIPDASQYNVHQDETLFLHEAIPGHHYQISLTQENEELPKFRKTLWYSGYGEGWALYSESLGKELGLYEDPYQYFGTLAAEMHRAIRLVVDTGLHSKGWTREEAIQYSMDNESESEASIISEIERYMANPGQALSYKIGQIKIKELREKAKIELGDNFDIAQYHNQVLETGCVPLALLEEKVNRWIEENK